MKLLLVAMNSIHFVRWTEQLKHAGHDVYWFDIQGTGKIHKLPWVTQITNWKQRFPNFKGRYFLKKHLPFVYKVFNFLFEKNTAKTFENVLQEVQPDVVHSFVLYIACTPIYQVMQKHKNLPWIYSSWGSDLFYYQNETKYLNNIKKVLPRINYLFADCKRDVDIAKKYGFTGTLLGVFPGGGGYPLQDYETYILPVKQRNIILVKGYQGRSGRSIQVLKALEQISNKLLNYKVVIFGADEEVEEHIINKNLSNILSIQVLSKHNFLPHNNILELMGKALIYIGNSNSDGMPNTLLEAIIMGAFPIQSNPGGATAEVIEHNKNGLLINDCEDSIEISELISSAISNLTLINNAFTINQESIKHNYEREVIANEVISKYSLINN